MNFEGDLHSWRYLARERLADWKAERERRIKAEGERDEARADLAEYVLAQALRTQSRPLTPDAITDEMVERYLNHRDPDEVRDWRLAGYRDDLVEKARAHLVAALTEPARPEGAEKLAEVIDGLFTGDEGIYADDLADSLARCGVRVVTEEQP